MKTIVISLAIIVLGTVMVYAALFSSHLQKPRSMIRNDILRYTPIGISMDEVLKAIESKKRWEVERISYDRGYIDYDNVVPGWRTSEATGYSVVGEKSITVYLGRRMLFWNMEASWGFDVDGKLIEVYIRETMV